MTTVYDLTDSWVEVATDRALFIIKRTGDGDLLIGNAQDEATARRLTGPDEIGRQMAQLDSVSTYARATGTGWKLAASLVGEGRLPDGMDEATALAGKIIERSIGDAKGDLIGFSADNTPVRIGPVGADGTVLIADAVSASGVKWQTLGTLPVDSDGHKYLGSAPSQTGLAVQTNTNGEAGTWATVDPSGPFTVFPGVTAENACYIGADNKADLAAIISNVTTAITLGGGAIVPEFWYGGGWTLADISVAKHISPYTYYANVPFGTVQKDDIRVSDGFYGMGSSVAKTLNGVTKHWLRFRITTGITTSPVIDGLWIIGSSTMISPAGEQFFFGESRPEAELMRLNIHEYWRRVSGNAPGNQSLGYATGTSLDVVMGQINNQLTDGAIDGMGGVFVATPDYDGSSGVSFGIHYYPSNANIGDIELETNIAKVSDGDIVNVGSRTASWSNLIFASSGIQESRATQTFRHRMTSVQAGDTVAFNILRDARAGNVDDTYSGNVILEMLDVTYRKWRL